MRSDQTSKAYHKHKPKHYYDEEDEVFMKAAESIVAAFREQKPVRMKAMKWGEFVEMLEKIKELS